MVSFISMKLSGGTLSKQKEKMNKFSNFGEKNPALVFGMALRCPEVILGENYVGKKSICKHSLTPNKKTTVEVKTAF